MARHRVGENNKILCLSVPSEQGSTTFRWLGRIGLWATMGRVRLDEMVGLEQRPHAAHNHVVMFSVEEHWGKLSLYQQSRLDNSPTFRPINRDATFIFGIYHTVFSQIS